MIQNKKKVSSSIQQLLMILITFVALFPIYYMLVTSLKTRYEYHQNIYGPPLHFTLTNFISAFRTRQQFLTWFFNSSIITFSSVAIGILFASFAAYAFAILDFQGKRTLFNFTISIMVIPAIIMIIPLFVSFVRIGIINMRPSAILVYVGLILPFCIYMLSNFFATIPKELQDAAKIDGCSHLHILILIMIPLSKPAMITLAVVNTLWIWNELLLAMIFLQSDNLKTLMVGLISFKSRNVLDIPMIMAGLLVTIIPMFIIYIIGIRYFMKGLYAGAIKG